MSRQKILFLITKSNWGENKNPFLFSLVCSEAADRRLLSKAKQAVGGPAPITQQRISTFIL
jgi:hypothetical protein